ncbi:MAG: hypothetical protein M0Q98_14215, partial [Pseudomonas sp.]|nr:hypothetical protein [Pseudomonas sp.]
ERTFRVVFVMAYRSTVNYFLSETINRIRHPLFPSYTTNDYSSSGTACNQFQSYRSADTRRATCNNNHLTV